jgi:hypothetical protein
MLKQKYQPWFAVAGLAFAVAAPAAAAAGTTTQGSDYLPAVPQDKPRITSPVDDSQRSALANTHSSLAVAANDKGALPDSLAFTDLTLTLKRSAVKQQAFEQLLSEQTNPRSPYFHHWLTAAQIGTMYGPEASDVAKVTKWLQSHGLQVKGVSADGLSLHFSGNVAELNGAFNASMHSYQVDGKQHFANANVEQIPAALAPLVQFVGLHNFFPKAQHVDVGLVKKDQASGHWKTAVSIRTQLTTWCRRTSTPSITSIRCGVRGYAVRARPSSCSKIPTLTWPTLRRFVRHSCRRTPKAR